MHLPINTKIQKIKLNNKKGNLWFSGERHADWSCDVNCRKSTTGYFFKLNRSGAALSFSVTKQTPNLLFLHRMQIRVWQQKFKRHCFCKHFWKVSDLNRNIQQQSERTTRAVSNRAKTQLCWRGACTLNTTLPNLGQLRRWDYLNSFRSFWQNGSWRCY